MGILNPTSAEKLVDQQGRPYFLWDIDMTLEVFRERLAHGDEVERAYLLGKMMRQAKPDDVFQFVTVAEIRAQWPRVERYLGRSHAFWSWILSAWSGAGQDAG